VNTDPLTNECPLHFYILRILAHLYISAPSPTRPTCWYQVHALHYLLKLIERPSLIYCAMYYQPMMPTDGLMPSVYPIPIDGPMPSASDTNRWADTEHISDTNGWADVHLPSAHLSASNAHLPLAHLSVSDAYLPLAHLLVSDTHWRLAHILVSDTYFMHCLPYTRHYQSQ